MKITRGEIDRCLASLESLQELIAGCDPLQLKTRPESTSWSPNEILADLAFCADIWGRKHHRYTFTGKPQDSRIPEFHPREQMHRSGYAEMDFHASYRTFSDQREALLHTLQGLSFADWSRGGVIGGREHTVFSHVLRMTLHEVERLDQFRNLLQLNELADRDPGRTGDFACQM